MGKFFKYDYGVAAALIYSTVVVSANLDKDVTTIVQLALRQATITFFTASTLVAYVMNIGERVKGKIRSYALGALLPAAIVAFSSFVAHWYFTNEYRNVLSPFVVSLVLNGITVTFARRGHTTLKTQFRHAVSLILRRS